MQAAVQTRESASGCDDAAAALPAAGVPCSFRSRGAARERPLSKHLLLPLLLLYCCCGGRPEPASIALGSSARAVSGEETTALCVVPSCAVTTATSSLK